MDTVLHDIRYTLRKLARSPGFTFVALATLTLAIGATTAIFSVVDGVLLRPLPFASPERILLLSEVGRDGRPFPLSGPDYIDFRDQSKSFEAMAQFDNGNVNLTGNGVQPLRLAQGRVGARFFDILGLRAQVGRSFRPDDDAVGGPRIAMLSDAFWRTHFGADPRIIGQTISLDGNPHTVVGVASPDARFPARMDVFVPFQWQPYEIDPNNRGAHSFYALGKLRPNATIEGARTELRAIAKRLEAQYPQSNTGFSAGAQLLQEEMVGKLRPALFAMLGAVGFVLLIACANIANLLLVRAAAREGEIAVRTALGAGRSRIVRQLVTESVLLAVGGAVLGTGLAMWAVDAVVAFGPHDLPRLEEVAVNGRVLAFTGGIAMLTGILFGLVPAFHAARPDIGAMLRESVRGTSRGGTNRTRNALVVTEMALAVILLVGAGLLIRSFARLTNVDPGFRPERVLSFDVSLPNAKYQWDADLVRFTDQVVNRLRQLPGTQSAAVIFGRPMSPYRIGTVFDVVGQPPSGPNDRKMTMVNPASADYLRVMSIPTIRGRAFEAADDRPGAVPVALVSQAFVKRYFPQEDPIGKRITLGMSHTRAKGDTGVTAGGLIVGIVGDVKARDLTQEMQPTVYLPFSSYPIGDASFVVRTTSDLATLQTAIRGVVREADPDVPVHGMQTMEHVIAESVSQPRFYAMLLTAFAAIALILAALGIYGVISYVVSQRTRELGIRIALGASQGRVVKLVLGHGMWMTVVGVAIGLVSAVWLARLIKSLLFSVTTVDTLTFATVPLVLVGIAAVASYLPARRAARVDPVVTMRAE